MGPGNLKTNYLEISKKSIVHTLTTEHTPSKTYENSDPPTIPNGLTNEYTYTLFGTVSVSKTNILMEVDTGALLSVFSEQSFWAIASPTEQLTANEHYTHHLFGLQSLY